MIVVCPNTIVSKLVYDWIAGADVEADDDGEVTATRVRPGELLLRTWSTASGSTARARSSSTPRSSSPARR
jgi:type III restriction enzyme